MKRNKFVCKKYNAVVLFFHGELIPSTIENARCIKTVFNADLRTVFDAPASLLWPNSFNTQLVPLFLTTVNLPAWQSP